MLDQKERMCAREKGKGRKRNSGDERKEGEMIRTLGLLDPFHAFVVLHRFRQRCHSRVTDVVDAETARIALEYTNRKVQGKVLDQKRGCTRGKREGKKKK